MAFLVTYLLSEAEALQMYSISQVQSGLTGTFQFCVAVISEYT